MRPSHHRRRPQRAGGGVLSRARGPQPLVLEKRTDVGGCAVTHEIHPGLSRSRARTRGRRPRRHRPRSSARATGAAHRAARDDDLRAVGGWPRADALARSRKTSQALAAWSPQDAERWPEFQEATDDIARVLDRLMRLVPPSIDRPSPAELWDLLRLGKTSEASAASAYRCCAGDRWPSPISRRSGARRRCCARVVAARGTFGANAGPWSAGTTLGWMLQAAAERHPAGAPSFVVSGPGSLAVALAVVATSAGAEIPHQRERGADRGGRCRCDGGRPRQRRDDRDRHSAFERRPEAHAARSCRPDAARAVVPAADSATTHCRA